MVDLNASPWAYPSIDGNVTPLGCDWSPASNNTGGCVNSQTSWLFNDAGDTEGWTAVSVQAQIVSGGIWTINPNPSDPQLISPLLSRAPSSINYLKYGVRNQGSDTAGRVYYSGPSHGYSQTNSKAFTNPNNGLYNWIVVRLNDIPGWNDGSLTNIDHIRIDPVNAGSGSGALDDVLTDYIFLRNDVTNPSQPTITSVTPGSWTNGSVTACFESNDPADVNPVGPDAYGSGIADFRYRVDPQADQVKLPDSFNQTTGLAAACVTYAPGSLANGANQFHVYCFDKVGRVSVDRQTTLYYDGINPVNPTITLSSHTCGAWSTGNTIAVSWPGASDAHSGIAGYSWEFSASPSTVPDAAIDGAGTGTTSGALPDGTWYFHVRTIDNAGNSVTAHSCA